MLRKNSLEKSAENVFLYSHEYRDQKMWENTRETIFPETHEFCQQKMLGKNRRKKVRKKLFFIFTRIS